MFIEFPAPDSIPAEYVEQWPTIKVPAKYVVCSTCEGKGSHSIRLGVINREDWDDESFDAYLRGDYDAICEECKGQRVVLDIDEVRATPEEIKLYNDYQAEQYEYRMESQMEYMMTAEYTHEVRGW